MSEAKIYVGTYAKYNDGSVAGDWVDLTDFSTVEEFLEKCKEIHDDEEDPEFMYQDFEDFPRHFYSESSISQNLFDYLSAIAEMNSETAAAFEEFCENDNSLYSDLDSAKENFEDSFQGNYADGETFAEDFFNECYEIPSRLADYIDYERVWRHLSSEGYWISDSGNVFSPY